MRIGYSFGYKWTPRAWDMVKQFAWYSLPPRDFWDNRDPGEVWDLPFEDFADYRAWGNAIAAIYSAIQSECLDGVLHALRKIPAREIE